ncbi:hypothetical protein PsorP6_012488 [Peronosclerospora sorghi]|uniref:Uncharacterized protein n=1 Tax=Peronosclerospora sorghi TaxID=230839 RepID=A0ACC0WE71_9STRA|nr:hypothetical protein PsorP6_012488 [Peronosclerospora sorghi]
MDPFGDERAEEGHVPQDISDFVPSTDNSGDFFEVEHTENFQHSEETGYEYTEQQSYAPMGFPPETPVTYQAQVPPMEIPVQIPAVEEENELTKFMREFEEKIAIKAQEQEKVAIECKAKAEENMAQFLAERLRIKESKMHSNRVFEQATLEKMVADLENENPWERVVTLVDLETTRKKKLDALNKNDSNKQEPKPVAVPAKKTKEDEEDVSRMRQLFVQLKATPLEKTRGNAVASH